MKKYEKNTANKGLIFIEFMYITKRNKQTNKKLQTQMDTSKEISSEPSIKGKKGNKYFKIFS